MKKYNLKNAKKEKKIESQSYSKEDLTQFNSLVDFTSLMFDSVKPETKVSLVSTKYTQSDKKKFQNIISNKFETSDNVSNKNDEIETIKKNTKIVNFTPEDEKQFEKLKNFSLNMFSNHDAYKKENEKVIFDSVNYSEKDLSAFNRILNNKKSNINNKKEQKELSSKFNKSSIKIIDYDKIENRANNFNIGRNKKIKIKYYD